MEVRAERRDGEWFVTVRVDQDGHRTEHRVTVRDEDLARYGATDAADLVRRSFEFLPARVPNTSVLCAVRVTEIKRKFTEYAAMILAP